MTKDEMRFLRREIINECLQATWTDGTKYSLTTIKTFVRIGEFVNYGFELKAYADD